MHFILLSIVYSKFILIVSNVRTSFFKAVKCSNMCVYVYVSVYVYVDISDFVCLYICTTVLYMTVYHSYIYMYYSFFFLSCICWQILGKFPKLGHCELYCNEYSSRNSALGCRFNFLGVNT